MGEQAGVCSPTSVRYGIQSALEGMYFTFLTVQISDVSESPLPLKA
ncbi:MAG: hypothetical protein JHC83_10625 [Thermoleophilia bacterium]|nr:hypothetical protein [Thermoleophilia bacterium]